MELTVRTLRTDGSIKITTEYARDGQSAANGLVEIGARLRQADPTVAACRADEVTPVGAIPGHTWLGHHNQDQLDALAASERKRQETGIDW